MSETGGRASADRLARIFYEFCAAAGAVVLVMTVLLAFDAFELKGPVATLFRALIFRLGIVAPVGLFAVIVLVAALRGGGRSPRFEACRRFAESPWVVRGLCVSAALAFLATEIGKLAHQPEMREFFVGSGYAVWFLYVVIAVETVGAVGLLVPTVRTVAACGLALIMVGAIVTHARNGDPFSDSYEAAHLLLILLCIVTLSVLQDRANPVIPRSQRRGIRDSTSRGAS